MNPRFEQADLVLRPQFRRFGVTDAVRLGSLDEKELLGSLDVIGHERTHGVTSAEADLDYEAEPDALNEDAHPSF